MSWPRDCGIVAVLQNRFKPGHCTSLPTAKQLLGVVDVGKPDMKEINFHVFHI